MGWGTDITLATADHAMVFHQYIMNRDVWIMSEFAWNIILFYVSF